MPPGIYLRLVYGRKYISQPHTRLSLTYNLEWSKSTSASHALIHSQPQPSLNSTGPQTLEHRLLASLLSYGITRRNSTNDGHGKDHTASSVWTRHKRSDEVALQDGEYMELKPANAGRTTTRIERVIISVWVFSLYPNILCSDVAGEEKNHYDWMFYSCLSEEW
jgi:hypothetical protein